jgi:pantoate--beta-alanine ligase
MLESGGLRPDYFSICHADSLTAAQPDDKQLVILAAAYAGNTRLIDNIEVML